MSSNTKPNNNWIVGVVLGLSASIAINLGNNLQSLGLKRLRELKEREVENRDTDFKNCCAFVSKFHSKSIAPESTVHAVAKGSQCTKSYHSKLWIIGTVIFVTGTIFNFYSYAFAAQSLLASLESVQFVTNLMFGSCMLGAKITRQMIFGTVLTVVGTILAVQFSSKSAIQYSLQDMIVLYTNPAYLVYLGITFALLIFLRLLYRHHVRLERMNRPNRYTSLTIPWSFSIGSALVGTQSVVQAKILSELLTSQFMGIENIFRSWFAYLTVIIWLFTASIWLKQLSDALGQFDPLFIIPLLHCSFIFFAIISGGIYFKEFNTFSAQQWIGFWGSICIMFLGLFLVSARRATTEKVIMRNVADLLLRNQILNQQDASVFYQSSSQNNTPSVPNKSKYLESKPFQAGRENALPNSTNRTPDETLQVKDTGPKVGHVTLETLSVAVKGTAKTAANGAKILLANHTTLLANAALISMGKQTEDAAKRKDLLLHAQDLLLQRTRESEGFSQQISDIVSQIKTDLGIPTETVEETEDLIPRSIVDE